MERAEESINAWLSLQLTYHPCQWRSIVVNFGFFHPPLTVGITEKRQHIPKRLLGVLQHIAECPALPIAQKLLA